jgi:hypothetical protein
MGPPVAKDWREVNGKRTDKVQARSDLCCCTSRVPGACGRDHRNLCQDNMSHHLGLQQMSSLRIDWICHRSRLCHSGEAARHHCYWDCEPIRIHHESHVDLLDTRGSFFHLGQSGEDCQDQLDRRGHRPACHVPMRRRIL